MSEQCLFVNEIVELQKTNKILSEKLAIAMEALNEISVSVDHNLWGDSLTSEAVIAIEALKNIGDIE